MREVIFFHGQDCPHCAIMRPIVKEIEKELKIKFNLFEVWYNEENADYMRTFEKIITRASSDGDMGVPAFVDAKNKEALVGEQEKKDLKKWVMEK